MDYVALAQDQGAKLDRADNGLWRVLDMPETFLWFAWFLDEKTAAWAFCYQRGLVSRDHFPSIDDQAVDLPHELPMWVADQLCRDGYTWSHPDHPERTVKSTPSFPHAVQALWRECVRIIQGKSND